MNHEAVLALVAKYKKIEAEKKAAAKAKREEDKKKLHREEVLKRRQQRANEHRKVEMYRISLKRKRKRWAKENRKRRRQRINHRYYIKHIKQPKIRRRLHKGDEYGRFFIFFVKDREYNKSYAWYKWKFNAIEAFSKMVNENHEKSICPKIYKTLNDAHKNIKFKDEIIICKKIDPETEKNETMFRDEFGGSVSVATDDPEMVIISKDVWYTEEDFYLYGYHPKYDRKKIGWVIDNVIMKCVEKYGMCRIFIWKSYLFIENDNDFTFLLTKSPIESVRLYNILYDRLENVENLYFTGSLSRGSIHRWFDKIKEKTGWSDVDIKKCHPIH